MLFQILFIYELQKMIHIQQFYYYIVISRMLLVR